MLCGNWFSSPRHGSAYSDGSPQYLSLLSSPPPKRETNLTSTGPWAARKPRACTISSTARFKQDTSPKRSKMVSSKPRCRLLWSTMAPYDPHRTSACSGLGALTSPRSPLKLLLDRNQPTSPRSQLLPPSHDPEPTILSVRAHGLKLEA